MGNLGEPSRLSVVMQQEAIFFNATRGDFGEPSGLSVFWDDLWKHDFWVTKSYPCLAMGGVTDNSFMSQK